MKMAEGFTRIEDWPAIRSHVGRSMAPASGLS